MDNPGEIRKGEDLDWQSLKSYLQSNLPGIQGEMKVAQFHGGHANLTYLLKFKDSEWVLRRPPFGKIAPGAHDMKREYRVLSKLYQHFSPAPQAYLYCANGDIIGAPFVILERRLGITMRYKVPDAFSHFENVAKRLTIAMIKALADLHEVDVAKAELSDLGRPEGYLDRQLAGWFKRWEMSKTTDYPHMTEIYKILADDIPEPQAISIIHNDIKFDNCQFQAENPDQVSSIFDWDMTTLGDPLADFATTLSYWPDARLKGIENLPVTLKGDFPDKTFLKEKYAQFSGFSLDRMAWYEAYAYWKGAIIAQQLYQRYVNGQTKDVRMKGFGQSAVVLANLAHQIVSAI